MVTAERAFRRRDLDRAEAELTAAVKVAEAFGKTDERLGVSLGRLAQVYAMQGKYAEAIGPAKRLLEAREAALGPDHLNVADALNNLAGLYMDTDQPKKAKPLLERALAICQGDERTHERLRAIVLDNLAELERDQGNLDAAETAARKALALRKAHFGESHPWYAKSRETVGTIHLARGEAAEAEEAFRECLSIRRMKMGWNRPVIIRSLVHLAAACKAQKKYGPAENYYKQAIRMGEGGLGRNDDARAETYEAYADLLRKTDRAAEADEMAEEAETIREALEK
jgi:tetratricopeptide (TPR) repeat protein